MGILSGLGWDHQCVVAFDLQPAAVEDGIVTKVGVETDVLARRSVSVAHRLSRRVAHQMVQTRAGDEVIPIHPADSADPLITGAADAPAQEEVMFSPITWVELWSRLRLPAPFAPPATRRRAFTAGHLKRSLSAPCRAWSRPAPAPLPSAEAPSVSDARGSPGLPEGRQGEWLWCHNTSRLPSATPTKPGPAVSNLGPGCRVGSASCAQDPVQCCWCGPYWSRFSGMPGQHARPTGFSVHRQAHAKACSRCRLRCGSRRGGQRSGPIHRLGPERHFPCSPGPFQAPRSHAGTPRPAEPSETTGQAKFLREDAFRRGIRLLGIRSGWGWGSWPPVRQRDMDYLRARLVTPCYYKKVIATGVMNHDRFVGVDAPYRDAQKGR